MADSFLGFYRASVVGTNDPKSRGRVRLRVPAVFGEVTTPWVPPLINTIPPTKGDVVWVTFEAGDKSRPFFLGNPEGGGGTGGGDHNHDGDYATTPHSVAGSHHSASSLSNFNTKISDATLDDSSDPRPPLDHTHDALYADIEHEHGGGDGVYVSDTPPSAPEHDELWVDTADTVMPTTSDHNDFSGRDAVDAHPQYALTEDLAHEHDADYASLAHGHPGEWGDRATSVTSVGDWNDVQDSGIYRGQSLANASPYGSHSWQYTLVIQHDVDFIVQTAWNFAGEMSFRRKSSGVWQDWQALVNDKDTGWVKPTNLQNNWVDYDPNSTTSSYGLGVRRFGNLVQMKGLARHGNYDAIILGLPAGFTPIARFLVTALTASGGSARMDFREDGNIYVGPSTDSNSWISVASTFVTNDSWPT